MEDPGDMEGFLKEITQKGLLKKPLRPVGDPSLTSEGDREVFIGAGTSEPLNDGTNDRFTKMCTTL
jgi:hypothetical protein